MKNWMRIFFVAFVLIGGTALFGYWSFDQFSSVIDNLSVSYTASVLPVSSLSETNSEEISANLAEIATSTPETAGTEIASTTVPEIATALATSTTSQISTTSPEIKVTALATSTDLQLSLVFPKKDEEIYIGCLYQISWKSSSTINSLEMALFDAGTKKASGPKSSGLARENNIEPDSKSLKWKVGAVWPGKYYILISKINGVNAETQSKVFTINKLTKGISAKEKEKICNQSSPSL